MGHPPRGSVAAGAGASAARHPGRAGGADDDGDDYRVTFWTAIAGVLLYPAGSAVVLL